MANMLGRMAGADANSLAELRAYEPTFRDHLARILLNVGLPERTVEGLMGSRGIGPTQRNAGVGLVDFTPLGIPLAVNEAERAGEAGDWVGATVNAMAMVPGAKAGTKAIEAGLNEVKQGIRAYHGSPHDFDRFDLSKIGTGEGAQAYGHGLYFAENEGVAKEYRKNLTQSRIASAQRALAKSGGDVEAAMAAARAEIDRLKALPNAGGDVERRDSLIRLQEERLSELNLLKNSGEMSPGRTYEVSINAHPDEFLDWDKPLPKEHPLREVLAEIGMEKSGGITAAERNAGKDAFLAARNENLTGEGVYTRIGKALGDKVTAAEELRKRGIKGIRYKDAGSRGSPLFKVTDGDGRVLSHERTADDAQKALTRLKGQYPKATIVEPTEGTSNFVVFSDDIIQILRKYGIAGLTAGGFGALAAAGMPTEARAGE